MGWTDDVRKDMTEVCDEDFNKFKKMSEVNGRGS